MLIDLTIYLNYSNFPKFLLISSPIVWLDFVSPNNICLGFNNSSGWAQGNHQLHYYYYILGEISKNLFKFGVLDIGAENHTSKNKIQRTFLNFDFNP